MALTAVRRGAGLLRATVAPLTSEGAPRLDAQATTATGPPGPKRWRSHLGSLLFLAPAAVLLGAIVAYPTVATVGRSLFDQSGQSFIGLDNYKTLFGTAAILTVLRNNVIWVVVFPFLITFLGLVFAVLTERIRWSTAFKTIVFVPIVFSLFASGLVWRIIFETNPKTGVINAGVATVANAVSPPGVYAIDPGSGKNPSNLARSGMAPGPDKSLQSASTVGPGDVVKLGFTGIPVDQIPPTATPAHLPASASGAITGLAWRDFSPTHQTQKGQVFPDEKGLPSMRLTLLHDDGSKVAETTTAGDGSFRFDSVGSGTYRVRVDAGNFNGGFTGVNFLGIQSLTPTDRLGTTGQALLSLPIVVIAEIMAMLWIWAGFAMVVIGAGLAAMNREVLEAARIDGASEWQTFRRVTLPMLRSVLIVVLVTMIINVLKIFDIVLAMPPGDSSVQASNVIAVYMWQVGFTGAQNYGLSSAVAVILLLLVLPAMAFNVKRIKG